MLLIYSDNYNVDIFINGLNLIEPYQIIHDFAQYQESVGYKIAFTKGRSFDYDDSLYNNNELLIKTIENLRKHSDLVFSFDTEFHDFYWDIWEKCHKENVFWINSGYVNDSRYNVNIIQWMFHFEENVINYKEKFHYKLKDLIYDNEKPFLFDALLGLTRPHRDFIFNKIYENNLESKTILSYKKTPGLEGLDDFWQNFIWEPNTTRNFEGEQINTSHYYLWDGINISICNMLPIQVYNKSKYSIIAETNYINNYSFYTEKTAKPIIAKRLFIMFSSSKTLANLKKLGFKTFDNVIDESYDSIENDEQRWEAAFAQITKLSKLNQDFVQNEIQDIVDHNFDIMMNTNWRKKSCEQISEVINFYLLNSR